MGIHLSLIMRYCRKVFDILCLKRVLVKKLESEECLLSQTMHQ